MESELLVRYHFKIRKSNDLEYNDKEEINKMNKNKINSKTGLNKYNKMKL